MADGYGINRLEDYIDSIRDGGVTFEMQNLSKEVQEILRDLTKLIDQTVKGDIPTQQELKELQRAFYSYIQSSQTTTKETRNYVTQMFAQLFTRLDKLDKNRILHSFNANLSNMVRSGVLNVNKESAEKNILAQLLRVGYVSPLIKKVETFQDKLMSFLNIEKSQEKTKRRQFTEDLIEGLSRSKFFGGALTDFIRLGTFFIASWLKDKGTWGKALAVALVAAGPILGTVIAGAITKGITSFFTRFLPFVILGPIKWLGQQLGTWFVKIISTIWKANMAGARQISSATRVSGTKAAPSIATRESLILDSTGKPFIVDAKTGVPVGKEAAKAASKGLRLGKGLVGGVGGVLGSLALDSLSYAAVDHGVDARLAHGVSGVGQGALMGAWIGSIIPGIGTAVGAAVGGVVGGLVGVIKGHYDRQEELQEDSLSELKKKGKSNFWDNWFNRGSDSGSSGQDAGEYSIPNNSSKSDNLGTSNVSKVTGEDDFKRHKINSPYGWRTDPFTHERKWHSGIDLDYKEGDPVGARAAGKVTFAGKYGGYGNAVIVTDESTGLQYLYGHLDKINEGISGKEVGVGDIIGAAGSTGRSTGDHLHFEVRKDGKAIDPTGYLNIEGTKKENKAKKDSDEDKEISVADVAKLYFGLMLNSNPVTNPLGLSGQYAPGAKLGVGVSTSDVSEAIHEAQKSSIGIKEEERKGDIEDTTKSATDQAQEEWDRMKKEFREERNKEQTFVPPENEPVVDFSGTETFSKVLQSAVNIQQQTFQQR